MIQSKPTTQSVLTTLKKVRLLDIGRHLGLVLSPGSTRDEMVQVILDSGRLDFAGVLDLMGRDELKAACRVHGLDDSGRARPLLAGRLIESHGQDVRPTSVRFSSDRDPRLTPDKGDIVQVRHRQWLVEDVVAPGEPGQATAVHLVCLDDDNQGRSLEVLWELELGAKVLQPEKEGLGAVSRLDEPRRFGAYLHAIKMSRRCTSLKAGTKSTFMPRRTNSCPMAHTK